MKHFFLLLICGALTSFSDSNEIHIQRKPAELGKPYAFHISGAFSNRSVLEFYLMKGKQWVSFCYFPEPCHVSNNNSFNVSRTIHKNRFGFHLMIFNVTNTGDLHTEGTWDLITEDKENGRKTHSINLPVYDKGKDLKCNQFFHLDGILIICSIIRIYPSVQCHLVVRQTEKTVINSSKFIYDTDSLSGKSTCTFQVSQSLSGYYLATVTVYPNVTGTSADVVYGTNTTWNISIDFPAVNLEDCSEIIEEGHLVNCNCKAVKSDLKPSVSWFNESNHLITTDNVLSFLADRRNIGFICNAVNALGLKSSDLKYKPVVVTRVVNVTCNYTLNSFLTVTCGTHKVYPPAYCQFDLHLNKVFLFRPTTIEYQHIVKIIDGIVYYNSTCTFINRHFQYEPGLYEIGVIVYPNITDKYSDSAFGVRMSIVLDDFDQYSVSESQDLHYLAPVLVVPLLALVLITTAVGICIRKTRYFTEVNKRLSSHIYDTIEESRLSIH